MVQEVMTLVAPVSFAVATKRIAHYLRASGLPESLVLEWTTELVAAQPEPEKLDLPGLLMTASRRLDAWLVENLSLSPNESRTLLAIRAELPGWQSQTHWSAQFALWQTAPVQLWATPPPAELSMPIQVITLRSLRRFLTTACYRCLPMKQRVLTWLRGL
jgi:hypothetical protein